MQRTISPPIEDWDKLQQPLTDGELKVARFFNEYLPIEWEIYIQPHLNGLRPDFVLLHPQAGIAVFEVKDWNLNAMEYSVDVDSGRPVLMARDKSGGTWFRYQKNNPVDKVVLYKKEIYDLYCPALPEGKGLGVITAGVIFPFAEEKAIWRILSSSRRYYGMDEHWSVRELWPLAGRESLNEGLRAVFPRSTLTNCPEMNDDVARQARAWMIEPNFSKEQRTRLLSVLDKSQLKLVMSRTSTGYRRIRGPAGSGKSLVLAARAADLAYNGLQVLVITYNITLINYLADLAVRQCGGAARRNITWLNFHRWCRRVAEQTDNMTEYSGLWKDGEYTDEQGILDDALCRKTGEWLESDTEHSVPQYDAIFVDEVQDFFPSWIDLLSKVRKPNGELVVALDPTQDVYDRVREWKGFRGSWIEMKNCYRLPPVVAEKAKVFAQCFMPDATVLYPQTKQAELDLYPCRLRWIQLESGEDPVDACCKEMMDLLFGTGSDVAVSELTFIVDRKQLGMACEDRLKEKNIQAITTFSEEDRAARRKKMAFFMGSEKVKITTIHSFKGWETRTLVLYIGRASRPRDKAIIYTAMTRVLRNDRCSYMTVICSAPELLEYSKTWQ